MQLQKNREKGKILKKKYDIITEFKVDYQILCKKRVKAYLKAI